jgi:hypothetical protein
VIGHAGSQAVDRAASGIGIEVAHHPGELTKDEPASVIEIRAEVHGLAEAMQPHVGGPGRRQQQQGSVKLTV